MDTLLDLYSDYLISSFGPTTATGLTTLLPGGVSHDQVTRFLASQPRTSADLWKIAKPFVRRIQRDQAVMIIDDSISENPTLTRTTSSVGIMLIHISARSKASTFSRHSITAKASPCPLVLHWSPRPSITSTRKTARKKRRSPITKNEHYRTLLEQAVKNQIPFRYVLNDVWYSSADNILFIKHTLAKDFMMPIKTNRKVALSLADKRHGRYGSVDTLERKANAPMTIYLEGIDFPLLLVEQIFVNENGSTGILYLVTSDTTLSFDDITTIYQKRWHVEPYHKSLKQNASLEKSPTQTVTTRTNHFFAALCAFIKLELLKGTTKRNHFALKMKMYVNALQEAFATLRELQPVPLTA